MPNQDEEWQVTNSEIDESPISASSSSPDIAGPYQHPLASKVWAFISNATDVRVTCRIEIDETVLFSSPTLLAELVLEPNADTFSHVMYDNSIQQLRYRYWCTAGVASTTGHVRTWQLALMPTT
jgi:hypothetical protein